jgi:hypothetical protein
MRLTYKTTIEPQSVIDDAAFNVAERGHQRQSREKEDSMIGYIIHPVMVHRLLKEMGETDPITLAAALLHDVGEDCERYKENPALLMQDLAQELSRDSFKDAEPIAAHICAMVRQLTNPEKTEMVEGKRLWQVDHAARLTLPEAKVKLLDQTASVLDFIMMANAESFPDSKVEKWNFKALRLVKALAEEHAELKPWLNLHKELFSYAAKIIQARTSEEKAQLRAAFDWQTARENARNMKESADVPMARTVEHPNASEIAMGIVSIDLSAQGHVVGYHCLIDPSGKDEDRNSTFNEVVNSIESMKSTNRAVEGAPEVLKNRLVRHVIVKPPIEVGIFCDISHTCAALDNVYKVKIRRDALSLSVQGGRAA